ncbi:MAG TPA: hypothetical protein VG476_14300 [Acidimicrobiales bacterium]|nr:hypothetical protein [Acidimicrobiales bacterium]
MDGQRASLLLPGTTLVASLVAGTTYAVYRAHQLAERWKPRGVWLLPVLFIVATSISYVADGGTLTQPPAHGASGAAPSPRTTPPPTTAPPLATKGLPDAALPKQGLDITYDFGPPGSPHPVPGSASETAATFPLPSRATTPAPTGHAAPPPATSPSPPPPARPSPPPRRIIPPLPPLPPLPRPPVPRVPVPGLR